MDMNDTFDTLRRWDDRRPSLPGEHWIAFALGLRLLASHRRSFAGGLLSRALGAALLWRAVGGRDGLATLLRGDAAAPGRRTTRMDGRLVASAAEPQLPTMGDSVRTAREDLRGDLTMVR